LAQVKVPARSTPRNSHRTRTPLKEVLATYFRGGWGENTSPKTRWFADETAARAWLSNLGRRRCRGGALVVRLEGRDRFGIWHELPLDGASQ
jgi:hypothetical protein